MDSPAPEWTLTATATRPLSLLNTISAAMPIATWRRRSLIRARERLASTLGMGQLRLTGTMPSGHTGTLMPQRMYYIDPRTPLWTARTSAIQPACRPTPPSARSPCPARGVLATGQAMWQILDPAEYERTRSQTAAAARLTNRRYTRPSPTSPSTPCTAKSDHQAAPSMRPDGCGTRGETRHR